eukprot:ANDGO_01768.mRNA.1 putative catabolite repression protein creC
MNAAGSKSSDRIVSPEGTFVLRHELTLPASQNYRKRGGAIFRGGTVSCSAISVPAAPSEHDLDHDPKRKLSKTFKDIDLSQSSFSSLCSSTSGEAAPASASTHILISCFHDSIFSIFNISNEDAQHDVKFTVAPTCHAPNPARPLELLIGFESGDVVIHNPIASPHAYTRCFNQEGNVDSSKVVAVSWISPSLFVVAHESGNVYMYDRARPEDVQMAMRSSGSSVSRSTSESVMNDAVHSDGGLQIPSPSPSSSTFSTSSPGSIGSSVPAHIRHTRRKSQITLQKHSTRTNPMWRWSVHSRISAMAVSPNAKYLAVCCSSGLLYVHPLDFKSIVAQSQQSSGSVTAVCAQERVCHSYYGGFLCCAWSADSKYLATGGQDDLVCVFDNGPSACTLVAQGQAHSAFVSNLSFDALASPQAPDSANRSMYRLLSVGQDGQLFGWEFSPSDFPDPRSPGVAASQMRRSSSSVQSLASSVHTSMFQSTAAGLLFHLEPLFSGQVADAPICGLAVYSDFLVVQCMDAKLHFWVKPGVAAEYLPVECVTASSSETSPGVYPLSDVLNFNPQHDQPTERTGSKNDSEEPQTPQKKPNRSLDDSTVLSTPPRTPSDIRLQGMATPASPSA